MFRSETMVTAAHIPLMLRLKNKLAHVEEEGRTLDTRQKLDQVTQWAAVSEQHKGMMNLINDIYVKKQFNTLRIHSVDFLRKVR